ncbi:SRPBCC family protein [Celeribacter persicus]|uniref:Polyketide cyclase/dehydrase/lipid transport protein n=1 Tax=Celeribacter persicus TaxID=1651082 RepID=A0A2T5HP84_9RHOB|nr:SRPBCC family protein [Celeribacter persicus]PTQ73395.1 polyketide cyclase/dehydrase/lipid transport protein [Celeribacter persicus]
MKFSTRQDIEAPATFVFDRIADFESIERQAMRRGIELTRKRPSQPHGLGAGWSLKIPFRGKLRDLDAEITDFDAPNTLGASAVSGGLHMHMTVDLVPLSPQRTRLSFGYDVRPKTLSARILVQSVKFAKGTLQKRFEKRVVSYCEYLSEQYQGTPKM